MLTDLARLFIRLSQDYALVAIALVIAAHFSSVFFVRQGVGAMGVRGFYLSFGLVGTVVHELAHLIAAMVFFHRIGRVKLLTLDPNAPVRGYVEHAPRGINPWCMLGTPIISTAPVLVGAAIVALVSHWSFAGTSFAYGDYASLLSTHALNPQAWWLFLQGLVTVFAEQAGNPRVWTFVLVCLTLGAAAQLSGADWLNALTGVLILLVLFCLLAIVVPSLPALADWLRLSAPIQRALHLFNQSLVFFILTNTLLGCAFLLFRAGRWVIQVAITSAPVPMPAPPRTRPH